MENIFRACPRKAQKSKSSMKVLLSFFCLFFFCDTQRLSACSTGRFSDSSKYNKKEHYSKLVLSLQTEYWWQRPQKKIVGIKFLLQENASPHTTGTWQGMICDCGIKLLPQSAIWLFPVSRDEGWVEGRRFVDTEDISRATIK